MHPSDSEQQVPHPFTPPQSYPQVAAQTPTQPLQQPPTDLSAAVAGYAYPHAATPPPYAQHGMYPGQQPIPGAFQSAYAPYGHTQNPQLQTAPVAYPPPHYYPQPGAPLQAYPGIYGQPMTPFTPAAPPNAARVPPQAMSMQHEASQPVSTGHSSTANSTGLGSPVPDGMPFQANQSQPQSTQPSVPQGIPMMPQGAPQMPATYPGYQGGPPMMPYGYYPYMYGYPGGYYPPPVMQPGMDPSIAQIPVVQPTGQAAGQSVAQVAAPSSVPMQMPPVQDQPPAQHPRLQEQKVTGSEQAVRCGESSVQQRIDDPIDDVPVEQAGTSTLVEASTGLGLPVNQLSENAKNPTSEEQVETAAAREDEKSEQELDAFVNDLVARLEELDMPERVEIVTQAFEELGMDKCIEAIVSTFGPDVIQYD